MATPTLPSLWTDVLAQLNAYLNWDIVKGFMTVSVGLYLGSLALRLLGRAMH